MKPLCTSFILAYMTFLSFGVNAQDQLTDISISQNRTEVRGTKLYVDFDINISQLHIRSNQSLVLVPILQSGDKIIKIPEVIINGRNRQISYDRTIDHKKKHISYQEPYAVVKISKKGLSIINYKTVIPFETWMENSTLLLEEDICGCRNTMLNTNKLIIAQNIRTPHVISPSLTYLSSPLESSKSLQDSIASTLFFPESKSAILLDYGRNRQNITQTDSLLSNKYITVTGINIVGAASPEGQYNFNEQLSKKRALSLASYLESHYNTSSRLYKTKWVGEDWNSLLKLIEPSDMPYKQQVINIIKKTDLFSGRENDLMNLKSGEPYRYMQEYFFPQLRRVSYTIYYETTTINITKGRELIFSTPQLLSVNEMLLVANSYPQNSDEYKNAIEIAVKMYPENLIANINASSILLRAGDAIRAKQYLEPFKQYPDSWNNLGVMYMIEGNYELAYQYFQKAIDNGNIEAVHNIKELNHKRKVS